MTKTTSLAMMEKNVISALSATAKNVRQDIQQNVKHANLDIPERNVKWFALINVKEDVQSQVFVLNVNPAIQDLIVRSLNVLIIA